MEYEAKLPPKYMEATRVWEVEQGTAQLHEPRPRGRRLQALVRRPRAGLSDRRVVRGHARRAVDRGVLHERREGDPGHDALLRALSAGRGARLQRPRQGGGGVRVPREVLRLRRAVDRPARAARRQGKAGEARDARPVQDGAAARVPRAVRGAGEGEAARRPSARSRSARGRSRCCCATPRRCCSTPSRIRSSSTT